MALRALVFDDEEDVRDILTLFLRARGYEVLSFSDPGTFNTRCSCSEGKPCGDILITDNRMPRLTGLELVRRLLRNGCNGVVRNMAVISGHWTGADLREAGRLGCKTFHKPFRMEEIYKWLDECEGRINANSKLIDRPDVSVNCNVA